DDGAFPGHQGGQGLHLVEIHFGMIADASLVGAAYSVMLHPIPLEYPEIPLVVGDGKRDLGFAPAGSQQLPIILLDSQKVRSPVHAIVYRAERGEFRGRLDHGAFPDNLCAPEGAFSYYTTCPPETAIPPFQPENGRAREPSRYKQTVSGRICAREEPEKSATFCFT